ncbi:EBP2 [Symbiodinium natans]|uniref:EBP2 protein n=1 Tax=Symbiodinium natans TaxID=878477 RepID=A0A812JWB4_9DINO|nr:EBP2 [Symbiodinium natans]
MGKRSKECVEEDEADEEQPTKKLQTEPPEYEDPALDNDDGEPTQFSVSIGGLSFDTKRAAVRKACAKFGEVVTVRRWVRGAPRRADVSFSSAEEMEAAIQGMEGKELDGRTVKAKATPKEEEVEKVAVAEAEEEGEHNRAVQIAVGHRVLDKAAESAATCCTRLCQNTRRELDKFKAHAKTVCCTPSLLQSKSHTFELVFAFLTNSSEGHRFKVTRFSKENSVTFTVFSLDNVIVFGAYLLAAAGYSSISSVWDIDEEKLLRHFCLEDECKEVLAWLTEKDYKRPEAFAERLALSRRLREASNERVKESDIREAMMLALGSLHCLDFNKGQSVLQSEEQKKEALDATVPVLSNLSYIFLKRNDSHNSVRAATLGLTFCDRLADAPLPMRAKLLFRRGLGRCQAKDYTEASQDFLGAARILPEDREIRKALEECKESARKQNSDSHSRWRGMMTSGADKLKASARRCSRRARRQMREVLSMLAEPLLAQRSTGFVKLPEALPEYQPDDRKVSDRPSLGGPKFMITVQLRHRPPRRPTTDAAWVQFQSSPSEAEKLRRNAQRSASPSMHGRIDTSKIKQADVVIPVWALCTAAASPKGAMGRGKPRREKPEAPVGGPELADSDVEEADIEALARSKLGPGEFILGEEPKPPQDESAEVKDTAKRGVCLAPLLLQRLGEIEYKVPEGAKRVPWIDTMAIDGQNNLPKGVTAKDGVKLESAFLGMAAEAAAEGYRRLRVMKIPCTRPNDFYAEMMRPDKQMYRVRQQAAEEERRIKIVEDRKKHQASKKFAKKAKAKKLEARAQEKRTSLEQIANWRARKKSEGNNTDDQDLEEILSRQGKKKEQDGKGKGKGKAMKSAKRRSLDEKYGFGGKKKRSKQNDKSSTHDMSASPWGKGKAKGKGRGKGKGKGKGKGPGNKRKR